MELPSVCACHSSKNDKDDYFAENVGREKLGTCSIKRIFYPHPSEIHFHKLPLFQTILQPYKISFLLQVEQPHYLLCLFSKTFDKEKF